MGAVRLKRPERGACRKKRRRIRAKSTAKMTVAPQRESSQRQNRHYSRCPIDGRERQCRLRGLSAKHIRRYVPTALRNQKPPQNEPLPGRTQSCGADLRHYLV